ncbi:MAG: zinc ribbon domain-containing protein [Planctomycetales bacterium]|nr:zinc ribbon domain-containing protein [Planctomycetales bacterium]
MPLFEYHCKSCGSETEILVRNVEQTPVCPDCGANDLEKLLSVVAAPSVSGSSSLPVCESSARPSGNCGRPQCGSGSCMFG